VQSQYVFSRFRPGKACRDPEGMVFTTAAFVTRQFERLLIGGGRGGELRLFDPATGDMLALNDSSSDAVMKLQAQPQLPSTTGGGGGGGGGGHGGFGSRLLLAASSRSAVKLYDVDDFESPPVLTFDGCRAGHFSHSGRQVRACVRVRTNGSPQRTHGRITLGFLGLAFWSWQALRSVLGWALHSVR